MDRFRIWLASFILGHRLWSEVLKAVRKTEKNYPALLKRIEENLKRIEEKKRLHSSES